MLPSDNKIHLDYGLVSMEMSPLEYLRVQIRKAEAEITLSLKNATEEADLVRLALSIVKLCDEVARKLKELVPTKVVACRDGCDLCCRNLIQVNPLFTVLAFHEARCFFDKERYEILKKRLLSDTPYCPFLFDRKCSIYSVRPLVCRGYYSLDFELCKRGDYCEKNTGYQGEGSHAAHQFMIFLFVLENRIETIEKMLGLDGGAVFLNEAVKILLERPQTMSAWLSGAKVFPSVTVLKPGK